VSFPRSERSSSSLDTTTICRRNSHIVPSGNGPQSTRCQRDHLEFIARYILRYGVSRLNPISRGTSSCRLLREPSDPAAPAQFHAPSWAVSSNA
jgi:hypothetical protein